MTLVDNSSKTLRPVSLASCLISDVVASPVRADNENQSDYKLDIRCFLGEHLSSPLARDESGTCTSFDIDHIAHDLHDNMIPSLHSTR